ncbi:hypothetical protein SDC9_107769 [bioreactor metagenome]|uniref:Uncharacterized protein n=1 Tax=bioreactor metagenome TaxID=1076179 RepID=A0A645B659_9ZZZZ
MTLNRAFLITEKEIPAEMSLRVAPSLWACLTLEFMNTVHLVPRSTGFFDNTAASANSWTLISSDLANVSMKEPQPEEQASLSIMESITPFFMIMLFMSCPPMSIMKSTPFRKKSAAL